MKFYMIIKNTITPKDHQVVIPFDYNRSGSEYYSCLINLADKEFSKIKHSIMALSNFQELVPTNDIDIEYWDFLKSKHTFTKKKIYRDYGFNSFDLSNEDIMYMKLMGWIQ